MRKVASTISPPLFISPTIEKRGLGEDITEVYADAKDSGFELKIVRQIIKIRRDPP
jgi:hypothetical protein